MSSTSLPRAAILLRGLLAAAVTAAVAVPAHAAQADPGAASAQRKAASTASAQASTEQQLKNYNAVRASKFIGRSVRNTEGKDIGKIEDLVVDMTSGKVRYAMLAFDPGIFSAEKLFAVPVSELRTAAGRDEVVYDIRRDKLERASVDRKDWGSAYGGSDFVASLDKTYGITQPTRGARAHRVSDLLGKDVHDRAGKEIGDVQELVVDIGNQRVHYAVLAFDPGWTSPERNYAFPLQSFEFGRDGDKLVLDVDKSKVQAMRSFSDDRYANLNDRIWVLDVDRYLVAVIPLDKASGQGRTSSSGTGGTSSSSAGMSSGGGTSSGSETSPSSTASGRTTSGSLPAASADLPPVQRSGDVSYVTGGVGESEEQALKREMGRYPLSLEIVRHVGTADQYTADAQVRITDRSGNEVLQTVAAGPFLLADLPPGTYDVEVTLDGQTKRQRVSVERGDRERSLFVFQGAQGSGADAGSLSAAASRAPRADRH